MMSLRCRTYQYANKNRVPGTPSPHYKEVILAGAIEHSLPSDYISILSKIPTNGYNGAVQLKLKAINELNKDEEELMNGA